MNHQICGLLAACGLFFLGAVSSDSAIAGKLNRYTFFTAHSSGTLTPNTTSLVDSVFYNPAAVVHGDDGFEMHLSNIVTLGDYYFERGDVVKHFQLGTYFLPSVMLRWVDGDIALFGAVFPQAGGLVDVRDDAPVFDESREFLINASNESALNPGLIVSDVRFSDNRLRVLSAYLGGVAGISLKLNDMVSAAIAAKPVYSFGEVLLSGSIELFNEDFGWFDLPELKDSRILTEQEGWGVGGIFGVQVQPDPTLVMTLKYETVTQIKLETTPIEDPAGLSEAQGDFRTDIPAMLNLGVSKAFSRLRLRFDANYYFNRYADAGTILGVNINGILKDDWELALGAVYTVDDRLDVGAGIAYFDTGYSDEIRRSNRYSMDSLSVGTWSQFDITESITLGASILGVAYREGKTALTPATSQTPSAQTTLGLNFLIVATDLHWRF